MRGGRGALRRIRIAALAVALACAPDVDDQLAKAQQASEGGRPQEAIALLRSVLEREPLERLAADGQLAAYRHYGFWWAMDTARDKKHLDALCEAGAPPWTTL